MELDEELAVIQNFVVKMKRDRYLSFMRNPKRRAEAMRHLLHDIDPRHVIGIAPDQQHPETIAGLLRSRGAGDTCYAISENKAIDGKRIALTAALVETVGYGMDTIISCIPGTLAYFEGEAPSHRGILASRAGK